MKNEKVRSLVFCALFAAVIAVLAQVQIPLPGLVPISLATFGVMLSGLLLGWRCGTLAVAVYVLLGAVGIPVFAGFKGGLSALRDSAKHAGENAAGKEAQADNASAGAENTAAENTAAENTVKKYRRPRILVLHASIRATSNTLELWHRTAALLPEMEIREISLQNGTLYDCAGCPYHTCLHFGEKNSCFYGGVMVEEVYPAVREADAIVMLCANYNDALSANLTAFINRLTALFRQVRFYDKALFAVVVSGYSGSDIVAEQLIAALNMNKTFYLPPRFAMLETANDAGQAVRLPGIDARIRAFAENIRRTLLPC